MRGTLRGFYLALLAVWTWLLLKPQPVPESLIGGVALFDPEMLFFLLAKATHFSVYAGFAFLGGWLVPSQRGRLWLAVILILHGIASEIGQMVGAAHFDSKRHGCIRDMLIDAAGVAVGMWLTQRVRRLSNSWTISS